jgi:hypothetical protein
VPSAWLGATKQMVDGQFKQMCRQLHRSSISQSKHDTVVLLVGQLRWGRHVDSIPRSRNVLCLSSFFWPVRNKIVLSLMYKQLHFPKLASGKLTGGRFRPGTAFSRVIPLLHRPPLQPPWATE